MEANVIETKNANFKLNKYYELFDVVLHFQDALCTDALPVTGS